MIEKYEHVLWDWNGTLLDDVWLCIEIMNGILRRRRLAPITTDKYRRLFTFPVRDYYLKLGFDFDQESFEELGHEFMVQYETRRHECSLHAGADHALTRIRAAGKSQSILSAYLHETLVTLVREFRIEHFFDRILGIDSIYAPGKTEQGRRLMAELSIPPHTAVLIGDTLHDYEVASELGIDCILIARGHHAHEVLADCRVPILDSVEQLVRH